MLAALFVSLVSVQGLAHGPVEVFERTCLATAGDKAAIIQFAATTGAAREIAAVPFFPDAETATVFNVGAVTVRYETFTAVNEWVEMPPTGEALSTLLLTGRDPRRRPLPQVLREEPATAICMVEFDQGEADLMPDLQRMTVSGYPLSDFGPDLDFQTYIWKLNGPNLIHIQYGRADPERDEPGTRSRVSAGFQLP